MQYDHKLDEDIISQIEKNRGKCAFNELKQKTGTNSLTLARHLDDMENQGIIFRSSSPYNSPGENNVVVDDRHIGKKRYCCMTEAAKFERKHGIFRGVKSKREERNLSSSSGDGNRKERRRQQQQLSFSFGEKMNRFFQLLLLIAQRGALRYRRKTGEESELGCVLEYDPKEKRHVPFKISILPGVGESDFHADNIINVTDYRGIFGYLSPTEKEIKNLFRSLQSSDPQIIKQIEDEEGPYKEARYGLADKRLEELVSKILELFQYVYLALKAKWKYSKEPTPEEYRWYRTFYGDGKTRFFFTHLFREGYLESHDEQWFSRSGPQWVGNLLKRNFLKGQKNEYLRNCEYAKKKKDEIEQKYEDLINKISSPYSRTIRIMIDEIFSPLSAEKSYT